MAEKIQGKRILLDPLGGLYLDERVRQWLFQKKPVANVSGDVITAEVSSTVFDLLHTVGADAFATRCMKRSRFEIGESRQPMFRECAGQYLRHCEIRPSLRVDKTKNKLPQSVWGEGATTLERDARARVNFAKYIKADLVVAIDVTNMVVDEGLEVRHNGFGAASLVAENVVKEVAKRTRRKTFKVSGLMDDEAHYADVGAPVVILNCGSVLDPLTAKFLRDDWYRHFLALGLFAGIWKSLAASSYGAVPLDVLTSTRPKSP